MVQFRLDSNSVNGELGGRVEHVASGVTRNFQSLQELPELLLRMLSDVQRSQNEAKPGYAKEGYQ